jgi:hemerythrin superfamily protein
MPEKISPFVERLVKDHKGIRQVLGSILSPKDSEMWKYLGKWQGHEKLEEEYIFPILDQVYEVTVSEAGPERIKGLIERCVNICEHVERAEEDHRIFREFLRKYDELLPMALKVRLEAHLELEDTILFPLIRNMAKR